MPALLEALAQVEKRWYRLYSHFHKGCPNTSKNAGAGSESVGTYPSAFEKLVQVRVTLSPHSKASGLKHREKKRRDRNFDPIPALFRAIPAVLKMLG